MAGDSSQKSNEVLEDDDFTFVSKSTGAQGSSDEGGSQGAQGVQGVQDSGAQSAQSVQSMGGSQGAQGTQGQQSIQELPGSQGSQGAQGSQSIQEGAQGNAQSSQGAQGSQAAQEVDIFDLGEEHAQGAQKVQSDQKISFKSISTDLGITLENDTLDEFKEKVAKKIEDSKQEFKIDDYPDDAKALVKHLTEHGGKVEDFLNNKEIVSLYAVKNLEPEQKIAYIRTNELIKAGIDPDKAEEQANKELEEMSTKQIREQSDSIDADADKLISSEIKKITGDRATAVAKNKEKETARIKRENETLKSYVSKQTDFLGIKLSDKAKKSIINDIETGVFDEVANKTPESSKFAAYMMARFYKNIVAEINRTAQEQNRIGYNAALEKSMGALHKDKTGAQQGQSGHQQSKEKQGKFDKFLDSLGEDEG